MGTNCCRLNVLSFGLALGIIWGLGCFVLGLFAMGNYGTIVVNTLGSFYMGYQATFWGAIVGLFWGFIHAFILGALIAWLYNVFNKCCKKTVCCGDMSNQ